jgi:hypothetical protein
MLKLSDLFISDFLRQATAKESPLGSAKKILALERQGYI